MLHDITEISRSYQHIYFSVDVLAPATLLQVAERIVETGLDIRWGAEIRLEKYWTPERCDLLYKSGARAISVGFESGNQRILDCIKKGVRINRVPAILQSFHEAGIGVQMMGFTGFPTENLDEAMDSVRFLESNRNCWTFGGLGKFVLTPGAQVALHPERFGIHSLHARAGDDIVTHLEYEDPTDMGMRAPSWKSVRRSFPHAILIVHGWVELTHRTRFFTTTDMTPRSSMSWRYPLLPQGPVRQTLCGGSTARYSPIQIIIKLRTCSVVRRRPRADSKRS